MLQIHPFVSSAAMDEVRSFVAANLEQCSAELVEWLDSGNSGPMLSEVARRVTELTPQSLDPMQVARRVTELAAVTAVAELAAWRSHFPRHAYNPEGGRVALSSHAHPRAA